MLNGVMDLKEAAEKYNINIYTLKSACQNASKDLIEGIDFAKSGRVWLITKDAIERTWRKRRI